MIGITITAKAYAAIKATLPADTQTWPTSPGDQGDVVIWLDQATVDRLDAMRGPGESYSDAIIRIASGCPPVLLVAFLSVIPDDFLVNPMLSMNCGEVLLNKR
jgi:hypothetical protein